MKRNLITGVLMAATVGGLSGCAGLGGTYAEREHRWKVAFEQDMRALADDIDMICMTERPTRLTATHQR
ncbi:MAG: hypothetical protein FLDDKLPJ_01448 [Phycisphaerae bacterium]|nr:hypothetical protein [Phycisphaerae bacterium]